MAPSALSAPLATHRTLPPSPRSGHILNSCLLLLVTIVEGKVGVILLLCLLRRLSQIRVLLALPCQWEERDDNEYDHFTDENMEVLRTGVGDHTAGELGPHLWVPALTKPSLQGWHTVGTCLDVHQG